MIILFGGEKGGTGKSTLATNIAVYLARNGHDILLLDADNQGSASNWAATRTNDTTLPKVHCVEKSGQIASSVRDLSKRYDHVIIDAGGRDSKELRSAMLCANKLYIPIKASQFDLWTIDRMNTIVNEARSFNELLEAYVVISMAPTNPQINETTDAQSMLDSFEYLKLLPTIIRERKAYRDAILKGQGVLEGDNPKAKNEIEDLAKEILNGQLHAIRSSAS
jgi:chromosome partitioning protein